MGGRIQGLLAGLGPRIGFTSLKIVRAGAVSAGRNAIAGTSALQLAEYPPGLYRSVASYSGRVRISDSLGRAFVPAVIGIAGEGADADNMYRPADDPAWQADDPDPHPDRLRGTRLFLSAGTGPHDTLTDAHTLPLSAGGPPDQIIVGGLLTESIVAECTRSVAKTNGLKAVG